MWCNQCKIRQPGAFFLKTWHPSHLTNLWSGNLIVYCTSQLILLHLVWVHCASEKNCKEHIREICWYFDILIRQSDHVRHLFQDYMGQRTLFRLKQTQYTSAPQVMSFIISFYCNSEMVQNWDGIEIHQSLLFNKTPRWTNRAGLQEETILCSETFSFTTINFE